MTMMTELNFGDVGFHEVECFYDFHGHLEKVEYRHSDFLKIDLLPNLSITLIQMLEREFRFERAQAAGDE